MKTTKTKGKPDATDAIISQRLYNFRQNAGLSQEKLGDMIGVTFQQIQKYEKGTNRVAAGRLYSIAQALGVPVAAFFPDDGGPAAGSMIERKNGEITALRRSMKQHAASLMQAAHGVAE